MARVRAFQHDPRDDDRRSVVPGIAFVCPDDVDRLARCEGGKVEPANLAQPDDNPALCSVAKSRQGRVQKHDRPARGDGHGIFVKTTERSRRLTAMTMECDPVVSLCREDLKVRVLNVHRLAKDAHQFAGIGCEFETCGGEPEMIVVHDGPEQGRRADPVEQVAHDRDIVAQGNEVGKRRTRSSAAARQKPGRPAEILTPWKQQA